MTRTQAPKLPDPSDCRLSIMQDRLTWRHGYYRVEATLDPFGDLDYIQVYEAASGYETLACSNRASLHTLFETYAGLPFKAARRCAYRLWRKRVDELYRITGIYQFDGNLA